MVHGVVHARHRADHYDDEEEEVRVYRAAESAHGGIHYRGDGRDRDDRPLPDAEKRLAYLYRRQHHETGRYHVEHQPEIYGAETAQEGGGPARVAKLVELDVAFGA